MVQDNYTKQIALMTESKLKIIVLHKTFHDIDILVTQYTDFNENLSKRLFQI